MATEGKTFDPLLVDLNLTSTIDLHKKTTDYLSVVEQYDDEVVISNTKWYNECTPDPIISDATFFTELNNGEFKVASNNAGGVKLDTVTTEKKLDNKNIKDQLTSSQRLIKDDAGNPKVDGNRVAVQIQVTVPNSTGTDTTVETREVYADIVETPDKELTLNLQDTIGFDDLETEFVMFWLDKFRSSHSKIQENVKSSLSGKDTHYFADFSESIGQLENVESIKDTSTIWQWDVSSAILPKPTPHNSIVDYIVTDETRDLELEMTGKLNTVYRRNMISLIDDASTDTIKTFIVTSPVTSHGVNLTVDTEHYTRMKNVQSDISSIIIDYLGGSESLHRVLMHIKDHKNNQTIDKIRINMKIETQRVDVDILKNKIPKLQSTLTNDSSLS